MVDNWRKAEPLGLHGDESSEAEDSLDTRESDEPLGEWPERCDLTYGLSAFDVLRDNGE